MGEWHLTPREALAAQIKAMTGAEAPEFPRVGVISWILPTARATKLSNRRMIEGPSRRWNHTRFKGEEFNDSLRRHVVSLLEERGYMAVAPMLASYFKQQFRVTNGMTSNWSERHAAYAADMVLSVYRMA